MAEIFVRTRVGYHKVVFETDEELLEELARLDEQVRMVEEVIREFQPREMRYVKPGLEAAYRFTPSGQVELFHYPTKSIQCVVFALYAYHPDMVAANEVEVVTGIENAYGKVLRQTNNKKYFRIQNNLYGLSEDGINYFNVTVLPTLPSAVSADAGEDYE